MAASTVLAIRLTRATTNVRVLPLGFFLALTCFRLFRLLPTLHTAFWGLLSLIWLTGTVAARRLRPPKGAISWTGPELPRWLPPHLTPQVVVKPGARASAQVKGMLGQTLVVNAKTSLAWQENERGRLAQYAHELGHIGMGDTAVYGLLSTGLAFATLNELLLVSLGHSLDVLYWALLLFSWLALRTYLRSREYAADRVAMSVLPEGRYALEEAVRADAPKFILFGTHPTLNQRLRATEQPLETPFNNLDWTFFASGFMALTCAAEAFRAALHLFPRLETVATFWVCVATVAAVSGWSLSRPLGFSYTFIRGYRIIWWLFALFLGESTAIVIADWSAIDRRQVVTLVVLSSCFATLAGYVAKGVLIVSGVIETDRPDAAISGGAIQRLILTIPVFLLMYTIAYLTLAASGRSFVAHLIQSCLMITRSHNWGGCFPKRSRAPTRPSRRPERVRSRGAVLPVTWRR